MSEWTPKFKVNDTIKWLRINMFTDKGNVKDPNDRKRETSWEVKTIGEVDVSRKTYTFTEGGTAYGPAVDQTALLENKQGGLRKHSRNIKTGGKWSAKYKKSINCKRPKGFSQRQHCKYGRKKTRKNRH